MQAKESQEEKEKVEGEEQNLDEEVGSEEEPKKEDVAKKAGSEGKSDSDEWTLCDSEDVADYIPCLDNKEVIKNLPSTKRYEHHQRHCPSSPPTCVVFLPQGYHTPVPWPKSQDEERERHVLTLQSALEGTLQRADALDHQVQRLCIESKRLHKNNEKLQYLRREQELKCRELEAMTKQSLLEKEIASLKMSLEIILEKLKLSDSEQERLHIKLKDIKFSLQKSIREWDALNADHANEVAAFRMQNAANECKIQELMEQVQEKALQSEQLCQMEASRNSLAKKLHGQQSQLRSTKHE
ncbi:hypothetical protein L7F22_029839 [Adiantum nelumboides]|nr:hypothetical protein [Adiantum nelumboides]